ncbi:MAG: ArnT family glycosyltransferase [Flavobacteriaceae bacterium]
MKSLSRSFWFFALLILLVNLLQATYTELLKDEAYYWYYAKQLKWGYFDHPPFVALLASTSAFLSGEIGLRLGSVFLSIGAYFLVFFSLEKETQQRHSTNFWLVLLSLPLVNLYGFLTLPDSGTLFFTALFIFAYKQFLQQKNWATLWLAVAMAGLMYSKYTGILIILATLFSNLSLLKNRNAWIAVGLSLLFFSGHLWWLNENAFITLRFHFSERPNHAYSFGAFTGLFLLNAIALFGLFAYDIYRAVFRFKSADTFKRGLIFMTLGVLVFFFWSTFAKKSQLQWLLPACYPALILFFEQFDSGSNRPKRLKVIALLSLLLLAVLRVFMSVPQWSPWRLETHGVSDWALAIEQQTSTETVLFKDGYQKAALFEFYTGKPALSLNSLIYRPNAYDFDERWSSLQQQRLALVSYSSDGELTISELDEFFYYGPRFFDHFDELSSLKLEGESKAYVALLDTHKNAVAQVLLKTDGDGFIKPLIDQDPRIGEALAIRVGISHKNQPIQLISLSSFKPQIP